MERKLDAVESFRDGYKEGQMSVLKLINEFCGTTASNVQELIHMINQKEKANV